LVVGGGYIMLNHQPPNPVKAEKGRILLVYEVKKEGRIRYNEIGKCCPNNELTNSGAPIGYVRHQAA